jgi:HSP20 family molecular chaperone IbpA
MRVRGVYMTGTPQPIKVIKSATPEKTTEIILDALRNDFADWMTAKEDLVWRPAIELTKEGDEFGVRALIARMDSKDIEILVAPDILLIKGKTKASRKLLGSIKFPTAINPAKVHAELKDGMLSIKAEIAKGKQFEVAVPRAA